MIYRPYDMAISRSVRSVVNNGVTSAINSTVRRVVVRCPKHAAVNDRLAILIDSNKCLIYRSVYGALEPAPQKYRLGICPNCLQACLAQIICQERATHERGMLIHRDTSIEYRPYSPTYVQPVTLNL